MKFATLSEEFIAMASPLDNDCGEFVANHFRPRLCQNCQLPKSHHSQQPEIVKQHSSTGTYKPNNELSEADVKKTHEYYTALAHLIPPPKIVTLFAHEKIPAKLITQDALLAALDWLLPALDQAPNHPELKQLCVQLLGSSQFTENLFIAFGGPTALRGEHGFWGKLRAKLAEKGRSLVGVYRQEDLGRQLGTIELSKCFSRHLNFRNAERRMVRQDKVFELAEPMQSPNYTKYSEMNERKYIQLLAMMSHILNPGFQQAVTEACDAIGVEVQSAKPKSVLRMVNKLFSDHRMETPKPRPALNIDTMRCIARATDVADVKAILRALSDRFKGIALLKNGFDKTEEQAREDFNLRIITVIVVYDAQSTVGDLIKQPGVQETLDKYCKVPIGEPKDRWTRLSTEMRTFLEGCNMVGKPAKLLAEIQILYGPYLDVRHGMHFLYRLYRSATVVELQAEFNSNYMSLDDSATRKNIFDAAVNGHYFTVKDMIDKNPEMVHSVNSFGFTPLISATEGHNVDIVALLLDHGADINYQVPTGQASAGETALFIAAAYGSIEILTELCERGADTNICRELGACSPLQVSAQLQYTDCVEVLLRYGAKVNHLRSDLGSSALYSACYAGHLEVAQLLIQHGADIHNQNTEAGYYRTCLYAACEQDRPDVVTLLLKNNVDANKGIRLNDTPLVVASRRGHLECVKALFKERGSQLNLNKLTDEGQNPIIVCCQFNRHNVLKFLLQFPGLDVNIRSGKLTQFATPIWIASAVGAVRCVELLLKHPDVDIMARDQVLDADALWAACNTYHFECAQVLIKSGRFPANARSGKDGSTPLIEASRVGAVGIVEELLNMRGIDIELGKPVAPAEAGNNDQSNAVKETGGPSPLWLAAVNGHAEVVQTLLKAKADPDGSKGMFGSALSMAREYGHHEIVEILENSVIV